MTRPILALLSLLPCLACAQTAAPQPTYTFSEAWDVESHRMISGLTISPYKGKTSIFGVRGLSFNSLGFAGLETTSLGNEQAIAGVGGALTLSFPNSRFSASLWGAIGYAGTGQLAQDIRQVLGLGLAYQLAVQAPAETL